MMTRAERIKGEFVTSGAGHNPRGVTPRTLKEERRRLVNGSK
jgi:hypothetical protein